MEKFVVANDVRNFQFITEFKLSRDNAKNSNVTSKN